MKVGDLVELSSYGRKLKMLDDRCGKVGVVVRILSYDTFTVNWCSGPDQDRLTRKDLKHAI